MTTGSISPLALCFHIENHLHLQMRSCQGSFLLSAKQMMRLLYLRLNPGLARLRTKSTWNGWVIIRDGLEPRVHYLMDRSPFPFLWFVNFRAECEIEIGISHRNNEWINENESGRTRIEPPFFFWRTNHSLKGSIQKPVHEYHQYLLEEQQWRR